MTFKKLLTFLVTLTLCLSAKCQHEEIAYNKTTHSTFDILLKNFKGNPSDELYGFNWDNHKAHPIITEIPETYKIDLRDFSMPLKNKTNIITSKFGPRWGRNHNGIDINASHGDTIYAAFHGKVRVARYNKNGYGYFVVIRHLNGLETLYGHMCKLIAKPNEMVKAGDPIGLAGNSGRSTGVHLHFETRFCGLAINPAKFFSFKDKDVVDDFYLFKK